MSEDQTIRSPVRKPRIRHITGIRIHQLTLPDALALSSQLRNTNPEPPSTTPDVTGFQLGESSQLSASPDASGDVGPPPTLRRTPSSSSYATLHPSRRDRRASVSLVQPRLRQRSSSSSVATVSTSMPNRQGRVTRPRAPTLAGEAMEGHSARGSHAHVHEQARDQAAFAEVRKRSMVRCFVVFKMPPNPRVLDEPVRRLRERSSSRASIRSVKSVISVNGHRSTTAGSKLEVPRTLRRPGSIETLPRKTPAACGPTDSTSPTFSPHHTASASASLRAIQHSLLANGQAAGQGKPPTRTKLQAELKEFAASPKPSEAPATNTADPSEQSADPSARPKSPRIITPVEPRTDIDVPFFVSTIHRPSTHPRWLHLTSESDFAAWMAVEDAASSEFLLELWYEDVEKGWTRLQAADRLVDLGTLRRVEDDADLSDNSVEFSLEGEKGLWYLPPARDGFAGGEAGDAAATEDAAATSSSAKRHRQSVSGVVEKSLRETRMKKGTGIGALHQLVNMQAVIADTEREIAQVQEKINQLLREDVDRRTFRRDVHERADKCRWIREATASVEKSLRELRAKSTLRTTHVEDRRSTLLAAEEADEVVRGRAYELQEEITSLESDRAALIPAIHHLRSDHVQTLDFIFSIQPMDASALLYSILSVPLPIPAGARDPAPPLSLPPGSLPDGVVVDERTTAAALGYVALVVQLLGGLMGPTGGLPYPISCAGSKSLVKDVVSVMQGPRAFPLYARGAERYRFEYAVFLLNKNIESLAQDCHARILDMRHTLPNLKSLLLTLSSPAPPEPPAPYAVHTPTLASSSATIVDSRASSRYPSKSWAMPVMSPGSERSTADTDVGTASPASRGLASHPGNDTRRQQHEDTRAQALSSGA